MSRIDKDIQDLKRGQTQSDNWRPRGKGRGRGYQKKNNNREMNNTESEKMIKIKAGIGTQEFKLNKNSK